MRNVSDKIVEKIKTETSRLKTFFSENRSFFEIMWKNMVGPDKPQVTLYYGACALRARLIDLHIFSQNT